ncbi:flavodoxin FldB [Marinagarivorans algicola]|uniref:flavodoxin FldB n=1 Tax=Marinagarivorans algicola TaxID=1513270 RepID=UPI0006B5E9AE|nr:flavodoxin FldB [Marinagarivorans algicola]
MNNRKPIGLFYGSSTCYTQMSAEKISAVLGDEHVDIFNIADEPLSTAQFYSHLIFGIPTWDYGELQEDWEEVWPELDELDLSHATVALYGQGDQEGYPEWFLDAMGFLYHKLKHAGAKLVGYWPVEGYSFEGSKALTDDQTHFVGLALDDETQFDQSQARIELWCSTLRKAFTANE